MEQMDRFFDTSILESTEGAGAAEFAPIIDAGGVRIDPPIDPLDEASFWLTAAAEIEHALMVQYLFAAYSVRPGEGPHKATIAAQQRELLQIAREEMGHFVSAQNLLRLIGGPLNFRRQHTPFASQIYPFRFKLEALSLDSLAKYVQAEQPVELPDDTTVEDRALLEDIAIQARQQNDGHPVRHVGLIFDRLINLFKDILPDDVFLQERTEGQAHWADWGFRHFSSDEDKLRVQVHSVQPGNAAVMRQQAVQALTEIGAQGEGFEMLPPPSQSHFERFFAIYKALSEVDVPFAWPIVASPNTTLAPLDPPPMSMTPEGMLAQHNAKGRITNERTRRWAHLFNYRYRLLLNYVHHTFLLPGPLFVADGEKQGDRTPRGLLQYWAFDEMRRIRKLALKLVQMRRADDGDDHAGPPFELPYTLTLPGRESDRWSTHRSILVSSTMLLETMRADVFDADDPLLAHLAADDAARAALVASIAATNTVPAAALPTAFKKAVTILEEGVRGFSIDGAHMNALWAGAPGEGKIRDVFVEETFGGPILEIGDPDGSTLMKRLEDRDLGGSNQMPRHRPPLADERIQFLRAWIEAGALDSEPAGALGVIHEPAPKAEPAPDNGGGNGNGQGAALGFAADIKDLFRPFDVNAMNIFGINLHKFEDVRDKADRILVRVEDGSMPCDGAWPSDRVATFRKWMADGKKP